MPNRSWYFMHVVSEGLFSCLNYILKFEPIAHICTHYIYVYLDKFM